MIRTNLFFKVELEHDPADSPERIANQIVHQLLKVYGVRDAELSHLTQVEQ